MNTELETELKENTLEFKKNTVLFICTGNTCRSPMCAALYNARYAGLFGHAFSAGICADGSSISENAVKALENLGIDSTRDNNYKNHVSHTVTENDIITADSVVCVTSSHMMSLIIKYPSYISKFTTLPKEISDPFGGSISEYEKCLADINIALADMFYGE